MASHVANAPRNHVTDAIMRHAAAHDELRATRAVKGRQSKHAAAKPAKGRTVHPAKKASAALAATPILAAAPVAWHSGILRSSTDLLLVRPLAFIRNMLQGALAGLMTFFSAMQFSGAADVASLPQVTAALPESFNAMLAGFPTGVATGAVGIIGAAILFLNAGRGVARILGLMTFIAIATAFANGANKEDLVPYLTSIYEQIKGFLPLLAGLGL